VAISNIDLRVDSRQAVSGLKAAQRHVGLLNGATKGLLRTMGPLTVAFTGVALVRNYFKGFNEAEKATQALKTLGVEADRLNEKLLGVSNSLGGLYSQTQLTTAAYDVASAGFVKAADAAAVLEAAALGAKGGLSDLNTVGNALTSVLNAYGKSAKESERLVDGFIQTQNDGKIILDQYAKFIGRLAPTAAATNVSIEELNAAISTITAQGVPVQATFTGLNQALVSILKPSSEAEKLAKKLGIEFNETGLRSKGFADFMAEVKEKTGGSTTALVKLFGSVDALKAVLPLLNDDLVSFNKNLEKQTKSAGTANEASVLMSKTLSSQLSDIVNLTGNLVRVLDQVLGPALKNILDILKSIVSTAAEAIQLMTDVTMGGAYTQLGLAGSDLSLGSPFVGSGLQKKGLKRLQNVVTNMVTPGTVMSATNTDQLKKLQILVTRVENQAKRIDPRNPNRPIADDIISKAFNLSGLIQAKLMEMEATGTQRIKDATEYNGLTKEQSDLLDEITGKLNKMGQPLSQIDQMWNGIAVTISDGVTNAIMGAIEGTKSLGEVASNVFNQISRSLINYGVKAGLSGMFPWMAPALGFEERATGGPVSKSKPYLVGERGPEMFVPNSSGRIIPNNQMGGANVVVNVDASGSSVAGDAGQAEQLGSMLGAAVQAEIARQQRPGGLLARR